MTAKTTKLKSAPAKVTQSESPYTRDVLQKLLEAIPSERWCIGITTCLDTQHCALQHLSYTHGKPEAQLAINNLFIKHLHTGVSRVNDGHDPRYPQPTPRARVLAALKDLPA